MIARYKPKGISYVRNLPMSTMFDGVPFASRPYNIDFGFVGTFSPERGLETFLKAWHRCEVHYKESHLWIVGFDTGDGSYYKSRIEPLIDGITVHMLGRILFEDIAQFYRKMDVMVICGQGDNLQLKLGEALAAGVPIILRYGWMHKKIVGDGGVIWFDGSNEEAEIKSLVYAIKTATMSIDSLTIEARAKKLPFSWEGDVKRLESFYYFITAGSMKNEYKRIPTMC
jgi:glycosyltransferase involved in cell wall biosynthesis